jgi:hypothetical protein
MTGGESRREGGREGRAGREVICLAWKRCVGIAENGEKPIGKDIPRDDREVPTGNRQLRQMCSHIP